ncbi:MAG: hypothetical protein ACRD9R_19135 [Pyrinomonadaceae bacterium]
MRKIKPLFTLAAAAVLALGAGLTAFADTIRLRDGSVIRGQIVSFKDQQFVVLIGAGARGRRSRITLYMEDVESIEFESTAAGPATGGEDIANDATTNAGRTADDRADTRPSAPVTDNTTGGGRQTGRTSPPTGTNSGVAPAFFPIRIRVRADNFSNGWNDSGLMVRKGQRLRISATGRVSLGGGLYATPAGLSRPDNEKLMRNEPTGSLIAVIGDDNDEFIPVGNGREIVAPRDGRLFLGVNEGNLNDNSGAFDVTIEAEAVAGNRP